MADRQHSWDREAQQGRETRGNASYMVGLVWLGLILLGLAFAGGIIYWIYRAFAGFFSAYDAV